MPILHRGSEPLGWASLDPGKDSGADFGSEALQGPVFQTQTLFCFAQESHGSSPLAENRQNRRAVDSSKSEVSAWCLEVVGFFSTAASEIV